MGSIFLITGAALIGSAIGRSLSQMVWVIIFGGVLATASIVIFGASTPSMTVVKAVHDGLLFTMVVVVTGMFMHTRPRRG